MAKSSVLFFAILLNALIIVSEINSLYEQRPIVAKQASFAFYHPFAEAMAGIVADIPVMMIAVGFNVVLYFLSGLRREASSFFVFFLFVFVFSQTVSASPPMPTSLIMASDEHDIPHGRSCNKVDIPSLSHCWCFGSRYCDLHRFHDS